MPKTVSVPANPHRYHRAVPFEPPPPNPHPQTRPAWPGAASSSSHP